MAADRESSERALREVVFPGVEQAVVRCGLLACLPGRTGEGGRNCSYLCHPGAGGGGGSAELPSNVPTKTVINARTNTIFFFLSFLAVIRVENSSSPAAA